MATATKTARTATTATKAARPATRVVPLGDRIVVKQSRQEEVRASGLVIPDTAREKPQLGEVIAVGPGRLDDNGKRVPMEVGAGDRVLYSKYAGTEVKLDGDEVLVVSSRDILAKIG